MYTKIKTTNEFIILRSTGYIYPKNQLYVIAVRNVVSRSFL